MRTSQTTNDTQYRAVEELDEWRAKDPITRWEASLREHATLDDDGFKRVRAEVEVSVTAAFAEAAKAEDPDVEALYRHVYPRLRRRGGTVTPPKLTFRQGIREVMRSEMKADPRAIVLGEAVATWGGSAQVTTGLIEEFGSSRVIETPISENALVGQALGCALGGLSVFAEVYSADFLFCAGSEVLNDISKWRHQHRWEAPMHLVLRMPMASSGIAAGPEHTQCIEGYLHHVPRSRCRCARGA